MRISVMATCAKSFSRRALHAETSQERCHGLLPSTKQRASSLYIDAKRWKASHTTQKADTAAGSEARGGRCHGELDRAAAPYMPHHRPRCRPRNSMVDPAVFGM